ncbi:MAG: hypothetical protein NT165_01520 [Candidatus Falkowbacteria bacterium]|nr:hypothetical protein [Candidatus Falkowbacteria bacterium]
MKNKGQNILNLLSKKERVKIDASNGHDQRKLEKELAKNYHQTVINRIPFSV